MTEKEVLQLIEDDKVYWCKREGGSQAYLMNRNLISKLVSDGLAFDVKDGCCYREYYLTEAGRAVLNKE